MPLPAPPAQSIKLFIVLFPRTFAWQSLLLRMGTCHGYVLQHVDGSAVLICLGGGGGGGGGSLFERRKELFHVWLLQVHGQLVWFPNPDGDPFYWTTRLLFI